MEGLSAALLVRVALGVAHDMADEREREAWERLRELVSGADREPTGPTLPAEQELTDFGASPTSPARAEALIRALERRAQRDPRFDRDLNTWAQDVRRHSSVRDRSPGLRSASLHGSVVQSDSDASVTFAVYGPQAPSAAS
ncbi:hypothetical protein [Streptomyces sundarbansensis]